MTKPIRTTTRDRRTALAIRDRIPFITSGAMKGEERKPSDWNLAGSEGYLRGDDLERFESDRKRIVYVVWSYWTPIGWVTDDNVGYAVKQKFSVTTTKHQGNLYLIGGE